MSILDQVIANTGRSNVVNEQHDMGQISVDGADTRDAIADSLGFWKRGGTWDTCEMGISQEEVERRITEADTPEKRAALAAELRDRAIRRAGLVSRDGRLSVYTYEDLPWHGLGTTLSGNVTWQEACRAAEMHDWRLEKVATFADYNGVNVPTGAYAIMRQDTGKIVGSSVGSRYTIVSNEDAFRFMDQLVAEGHTVIESAGVIDDGSAVWVQTRRPEGFNVAGDEMESYILFSNRHDGTGSIHVHPTSVRTVCANTHRMAAMDRSKGISFRHTGNMRNKLDKARAKLGLVAKRQELFVEQANQIASKQVDPVSYFNAVLDDVLDVTVAEQKLTAANISDKSVLNTVLDIADVNAKVSEERRYKRAVKARAKMFDDIMERYESDRNNGNPRIAGSGWAAYNAISEAQDHGRNYKGSPRERAENRMVATVMSGAADTIKQTALDIALAQTA